MHQNNFDFLRFLFAFVVILGHIVALSTSPSLSFLSPYFDTHLCVTGFFVISGFLITQSCIRTNNFKKYIVKRANRLLPAYIFIIGVSALFFSFLSVLPLAQYFTDSGLYKYIGWNLVFMNFLQPCLPGVFTTVNKYCPVNGALWTIKLEVCFYLLLPLLVHYIKKTEKKYWLFAGMYILAWAYRFVFTYAYQKTGNNAYSILSHQLPGYMTYFICGMAMHYWFDAFQKYKNYLLPIALLVFVIEYRLGYENLLPIAWSIMVLYAAYSFSMFNGFGKYGDVSYGIYIFHFPIIQLAISWKFFEKYNPFAVSFVIIVIVIATAFLSWNLLEKRFLKRKQIPVVAGV